MMRAKRRALVPDTPWRTKFTVGGAAGSVLEAVLLRIARAGKNGSRPAATVAGMLNSDVAIMMGNGPGALVPFAGVELVAVAQNASSDVSRSAMASSVEFMVGLKMFFLMARFRTGWASRGR